jgi:alanine-synthesizing transaminase
LSPACGKHAAALSRHKKPAGSDRNAIMEEEFHRIRRLPPYVFAEVNAMKARARAAGEDIIDLGMGNPDQPTPAHIVDKLCEVVRDGRTHRYSNSRGIPGLRRAHAAYYQRRFGVDIDPESENIVTLGSKEGLANLAEAITTPGDVVLVPNPSYPIHPYGFIIAGANVRHIQIGPGIDFFAGLERAVVNSVPPPMALILNFPSNPTAQVVGLDFYRRVVEFCREHGIWILSDLAYAEIYYDAPPPSILQVPGAKEIAIEFTSMSKTYSMPGWRIGFAAGNKRLIHALARIKSYLDYGAFTPIQVAATAALNGPQDCIDEIRNRYRERRDVLIEGMADAGWDIPAPPATMFAWAPLPPGFEDLGSLEFSKLLLREAKVAVSPGMGFGEYGDGHVRIALVENRQRIRQAVRNLRQFLRSHGTGKRRSGPTAVTS